MSNERPYTYNFQPISSDTIPGHVAETLTEFSDHSPDKRLARESFRRVMVVDGGNDVASTYVADYPMTYDEDGFGPYSESHAQFVDISPEGKYIGRGKILHRHDGDDKMYSGKVSVVYTETVEGYRNKGLGTRRLGVMALFSRQFYDKPLHSDVGFARSDEAGAIWSRLHLAGKADTYIDTDGDLRYRIN